MGYNFLGVLFIWYTWPISERGPVSLKEVGMSKNNNKIFLPQYINTKPKITEIYLSQIQIRSLKWNSNR